MNTTVCRTPYNTPKLAFPFIWDREDNNNKEIKTVLIYGAVNVMCKNKK